MKKNKNIKKKQKNMTDEEKQKRRDYQNNIKKIWQMNKNKKEKITKKNIIKNIMQKKS